MDLQQKNKHLYLRAGFGISLPAFDRPVDTGVLLQGLFPKSAAANIEVVSAEEWAQYNPKAMKEMADETARKDMKKAFRERTKDINRLWMNEMVTTAYPLLEKTALFWHGHFATHLDNPYFDQKLLQVLRVNALGNFGEMLVQVSKSASMLQFLNNKQNRKQHANENFAREVMELFTLGRGHYTEDDIKEAARAFTGWSFDEQGDFVFHEKQHDAGSKKFLGKTGNFTGDDILKILLEQKQTAAFITQKLYRYYVSDERMDDKHVNALANEFYDSNYDISRLLRSIFTADWFYKDNVQGAKIKSPVELLVGYQRLLPMEFANKDTLINLQRTLGQYLFNPPNVAGWPGGKYWIDSSSLATRMRLPEAFFQSKELNLSSKETVAEMTNAHTMPITIDTQPSKPFRTGKVTVDWSSYIEYWRKYKKEDMAQAIAGYLLQAPISGEQLKDVLAFADDRSNEAYIKSLTILIMELPEYQLA
jgi:uncharacterized protein (DUF1800 family)